MQKERIVPFRTILDPTNDPLPSLLVGVCLVLAPDLKP